MRNIIRAAAVAAIALILCAAAQAGIARADSLPTAEVLWEKITQVNPGLNDYSVDLKIKVAAKYQFLNPRLDLEGTYYFKKPDRHKLKLKKASYFLNKYPNIFGWSLPPLKEFNTGVKTGNLGGRDYYVVTLTPKTIAGDIQSEEIWVDQKDYTFPRHIYRYKSGGVITLNITYRRESRFQVFDRMNASFAFPSENLNATADAAYGQYRLNQGIPDSFFDQN
jgi:outer membrane lipoprotein-sorting protein